MTKKTSVVFVFMEPSFQFDFNLTEFLYYKKVS